MWKHRRCFTMFYFKKKGHIRIDKHYIIYLPTSTSCETYLSNRKKNLGCIIHYKLRRYRIRNIYSKFMSKCPKICTGTHLNRYTFLQRYWFCKLFIFNDIHLYRTPFKDSINIHKQTLDYIVWVDKFVKIFSSDRAFVNIFPQICYYPYPTLWTIVKICIINNIKYLNVT